MESLHLGIAIVGIIVLLAFGAKHLTSKKRNGVGHGPRSDSDR